MKTFWEGVGPWQNSFILYSLSWSLFNRMLLLLRPSTSHIDPSVKRASRSLSLLYRFIWVILPPPFNPLPSLVGMVLSPVSFPSPRIRQDNTRGTLIPFPVPFPAQTNSSVASVSGPEACRRYASLKIKGRETCGRPASDKYPSAVALVEVFLPSCHAQRRDEPAPVVVHELVVHHEHVLRLSKTCLCPKYAQVGSPNWIIPAVLAECLSIQAILFLGPFSMR